MLIKCPKVMLPAALLLILITTACSDGSDNFERGDLETSQCAANAASALQACINTFNLAQGDCYAQGDVACASDNADFLSANAALADALNSSCTDGEFLGLSQEALVGRFQSACQAQSDAIAWRTFGGPQGAVWPEVSAGEQNCLQNAHSEVSRFFDAALGAMNECLADEECDATSLKQNQATAAATSASAIAEACPALDELIAVNPATYVALAEDQLDCTVATAHVDPGVLEPACGPTNVDVDALPSRTEWTQIILDSEKWGTMCGDGTDYAIYMRLAPEGQPVDRVVVGLEGGGVCLFEDDCRARLASSPQLFNAQDGAPSAGGLVGNVADNPFASWTQVYLPYCNQDVFIGGGVMEDFGDFSVPRYGAVNLRAGMRVARDIIWQIMDESSASGFRPDELVALFGGFSAGGYGTLYNYHWVLDDLLWPRTAAFPDAGGALDNGSILGVSGVGVVKLPVWGSQPFLPPYCFSGDCAVGPTNYRAFSPRLKQVPEQQYLILSNQKDNTQQRDSFFDDEAQFINTMRAAYCETKDLPGIQWYLTGDSENSIHVVSIRDEFYYGEVAGERMVDWFWRAATDADSISDWAEEGDFVNAVPGVNPFPCELPVN